jgi:nicotinate-nucleotide pyrophosphorylase (carboxylating)
MSEVRPLPALLYEPIVAAALREDLGRGGDQTTDSVVPADAICTARMVARRPGRIAGIAIACRAFTMLDERVAVEIAVGDGADVEAGTTLATISGPARAILTGERVALNLVSHLSGIATATTSAVAAVKGTRARVACTRKTTPGLRALEKYAVRAGGGFNHRFGLDDAVLIKDNHIAVAGGIGEAVRSVRNAVGHMVKVEVEVDSLAQLEAALEAGVDAVLLDNMDPATMSRAVSVVGGRAVVEASGGITPANVAAVAGAGVDVISLGWLTHSAPALDVALDIAQ